MISGFSFCASRRKNFPCSILEPTCCQLVKEMPMIRFDRRRVLTLCLILGFAFSFVSCYPAIRQEVTVSVPPSYEQYSKEELKTKEQSVQEAFDGFTEGIFRDSILQNTISLHYYLTDPKAFGIEDYPDRKSTRLNSSHAQLQG